MAPLDSEDVTVRAFSVSQINQAVGLALKDSFPDPFWVVGEVQGYDRDAAKAGQRRWGQVYFELVEKEEGTDAVKAGAKALMWGDAARKVAQRLGGLTLADGLKVKFLCAVDFYWPRASLQLKVLDADPEFTAGDMEKARRELVEKLKTQGLFDANRALPLPLAPRTVGLITSEGSAAYHDFLHELQAAGCGFSLRLADARMQGEETESSVLRALRALEEDPEVEVIALVRGGGSRSDLMWFDREKIAFAVARCSKPVLTGIGHEIDLSVADLVAHASQKTPTACAAFLVERVRAFESGVADAAARFAAEARERLSNASRGLSEAVTNWRHLAGMRLQEAGAGLSGAGPRLALSSRSRFTAWRDRLEAFRKELSLKDPRRLLERGYSLIYTASETLVKRRSQVKAGDVLTAQVQDGGFSIQVRSEHEKDR